MEKERNIFCSCKNCYHYDFRQLNKILGDYCPIAKQGIKDFLFCEKYEPTGKVEMKTDRNGNTTFTYTKLFD